MGMGSSFKATSSSTLPTRPFSPCILFTKRLIFKSPISLALVLILALLSHTSYASTESEQAVFRPQSIQDLIPDLIRADKWMTKQTTSRGYGLLFLDVIVNDHMGYQFSSDMQLDRSLGISMFYVRRQTGESVPTSYLRVNFDWPGVFKPNIFPGHWQFSQKVLRYLDLERDLKLEFPDATLKIRHNFGRRIPQPSPSHHQAFIWYNLHIAHEDVRNIFPPGALAEKCFYRFDRRPSVDPRVKDRFHDTQSIYISAEADPRDSESSIFIQGYKIDRQPNWMSRRSMESQTHQTGSS